MPKEPPGGPMKWPDHKRILNELRSIPQNAGDAVERVARVLLEATKETPFAAFAVVAQQGTGEDAFRLAEALLHDAGTTGQVELAGYGQCWMLVASARGHKPAADHPAARS